MPVDPIGLAFGLAGLPGLFTACLDILDRVSDARSYGEDYHIFVAKLKTERLRFLLWGRGAGLAEGGIPHELLQDPVVREGVCEVMQWVIHCFENSEMVRVRPGGGRIRALLGRRNVVGMVKQAQVGNLALGRTRERGQNTSLDRPRERAVKLQKEASLLMKTKWTLSGKRKAEKMIQQLGWFIDGLYSILPVSPTQHLRPTTLRLQQHLSSDTIVEIPEQLQLPPPEAENILDFATSGAMRNRINHCQVETSMRRRRKTHARRIAAATAGETEKYRVLANER
ncbi:hypothetical protein K440DRAFT_636246 [Wilcoxina mikolae CBS 423.85]|nr:hypothetical protein K440DRAFT_636246 [Wilcoxina mikolae CBS 423.85]